MVLQAYLHQTRHWLSFSMHKPRKTSIHFGYRGISHLRYEGVCSCIHIMSMLRSIPKAISSESWYILFEVLTLTVAISIRHLHFDNSCFYLSSVADFSNTGARDPTSAGRTPFSTHTKSDAVWASCLSMRRVNLSVALLLFSSIEVTQIDEQN